MIHRFGFVGPLKSRTLLVVLGLSVLIALANDTLVRAAENQLSESERRTGWKLLFDGKTTDGWRNYRQPKISEGWVVEGQALTRAKRGAGDIVTVNQYGSFELSLEYKIAPAGNSGIMFHVTEEADAPWQTGPEVQVQDNVAGHDPQKSGWLYQLYQPPIDPATEKTVDATRPVGQWNQVQLRVTPQQCEINVNGYRYALFEKGSEDWNDRVAKSKFSKYPNFGKPTEGFICLQDHGDPVAYRNIKIREIAADGSVPEPVDGELPVKAELTFAQLKWAGWDASDEKGRPEPLRPIVLTHAGDGSNRIFVANQWGEIYVFPNRSDVTESKVFVNLRDRVSYKDSENEEGLLGMAFHPKYGENGEFFIYYTTKHEPHTSIISRFRVSADDPDRADPESEQEIMRIPQPFWNHNGGTLAFGPDGYLYIGLGDGGAANDPFRNGQNPKTWLGSLLRIDVDHPAAGKKYGIPADNPFVSQKDAAPETYAYGFRNIWRLSFDRKTGDLWCADVGQNLWEEINLVTKGGNYGWNLREGHHPFGPEGSDRQPNLIEPIWEYDHVVGKSITGGVVYRGKEVPQLIGKYLYADYVAGKLWALTYDVDAKKVVRNEAIRAPELPVISFGEDEAGEVYFLVVAADGKGIYRFRSK